MSDLTGMPISSLPVADSIQDGDELVLYRPSTGKAYQTTEVMDEIKANTDLIDSSQYYKSGDSISLNASYCRFAGIVTSSGKELSFLIPLVKECQSVPSISLGSIFSVRTIDGTLISSYPSDATMDIYTVSGIGISIKITLASGLSCTNNSPINIQLSGNINF